MERDSGKDYSHVALPVDVCIPCLSIRIGESLRGYLVSDCSQLPRDAYPPSDGEGEDGWSDEGEQGMEGMIPVDVEVEEGIRKALHQWRNGITFKVDHVAPMDAAWMMPCGNAKCTTLGHVYMAIKASERVQQHLNTHKACWLHIQPWMEAPPSGEWRCYTRDGVVAFAAQRRPLNNIEVDFQQTSERLAALWKRYNLAEHLRSKVKDESRVLEVDVWLIDASQAKVLGIRVPSKEEVRLGV